MVPFFTRVWVQGSRQGSFLYGLVRDLKEALLGRQLKVLFLSFYFALSFPLLGLGMHLRVYIEGTIESKRGEEGIFGILLFTLGMICFNYICM